MENKFIIILALVFITNIAFSQQKGILLSSKIVDDTEFYKENKRVKIKTEDGDKHTGRIKIIDENTISINDKNIAIESIVKIRSQSLFSAILSTTLFVVGSVAIIGGLTATGGSGYAALGSAIAVVSGLIIEGLGFLVHAEGNNHKKEKWDYKIVTDYQED